MITERTSKFIKEHLLPNTAAHRRLQPSAGGLCWVVLLCYTNLVFTFLFGVPLTDKNRSDIRSNSCARDIGLKPPTKTAFWRISAGCTHRNNIMKKMLTKFIILLSTYSYFIVFPI